MEANQTEPSDKGEHFPFIYLIKRHNLTFFIDLKSRKMRARSLAIELVKDGVRADKIKGDRWVEDVGIPIAAGLIVGEALVGVGNAMYVVIWEAQ